LAKVFIIVEDTEEGIVYKAVSDPGFSQSMTVWTPAQRASLELLARLGDVEDIPEAANQVIL